MYDIIYIIIINSSSQRIWNTNSTSLHLSYHEHSHTYMTDETHQILVRDMMV